MPTLWDEPYRLQNGQVMSADWIEAFSGDVQYLKTGRPKNRVAAANGGETYTGAVNKQINANTAMFITPKSTPTANFIIGANIVVQSGTSGGSAQLGMQIDGVMQSAAFVIHFNAANYMTFPFWMYVTGKPFDIAFEVSFTWLSVGGITLTAPSGTTSYMWYQEV